MTTETQPALDGLARETLIGLYRSMLRTREVDHRVRILYRQGKVTGGVYSQVGHEAISVGSVSALRPDDIIAPMHRDLGAHLVRGMDLSQIFAQLLARQNVYTGGKDNALHIGDAELNVIPQISHLGVSIPVAAGAALTVRQRGGDAVAITYVGDGAINTGDFHEGLNFAAALHLPFILVIENNQFAYSTPVSRQVALEHLVDRARAYGVPGVRVDGNNVLDVYRATQEAAARARRGEGPTLIEAVTMRMRGHSENDNASYVPPELLEEWAQRDPVEGFERVLLESGMIDRGEIERMRVAIAEEVAAAAEWAEAQPMPEREHAFEGVYSESGGTHG